MTIYVIQLPSTIIVIDFKGGRNLKWRKLGQKMVPRAGRNSCESI